MTLKTCVECGEPCEGARCDEHQLQRPPKTNTTRRGYGWSWQKLSDKARRLQPWCSRCGATTDLTTDHLRWPARTLSDVDVLCRSCNAAKGKAEGRDAWKHKHQPAGRQRGAQDPRGTTLDRSAPDPGGKARKSTQFVPTTFREVI